MWKAVAFVIVIGLIFCENNYRYVFKWRSFITSPQELQNAFDGDFNGMEALVYLKNNNKTPVIGSKDSTYHVKEFIDKVIGYHNKNLTNESLRKKVVFYFYETDDITVVRETVDLLQQKENEINFEIWLRASLIKDQSVGCDDQYQVFTDAIGFLEQVKRLEHVVLSVRWVTCKQALDPTWGYDETVTGAMLTKLQNAKVHENKDQEINLFVRAHYAYKSKENLKKLFDKLHENNPVTFTIYSDEQYWFSGSLTDLKIDELKKAIEFFGFENVYLQVSDKIRDELKLYNLPNKSRKPYSASSISQPSLYLTVAFVAFKFGIIFVLY